MSLGPVLDVAIGLMFIYLLLSLVATAAQETFAGLLNKRGVELEKGLRSLLAGTDTAFFQGIWDHSLVRDKDAGGRPSYVSTTSFSTAVLDTLMDGKAKPVLADVNKAIGDLPEGRAKQALTALSREAGNDLEALQHGIEHWFDSAMNRVSGAYKRWTQVFALLFGMLIAVSMNVNSFEIARVLYLDKPMRDAVVGQATAQMANFAPNADPADVEKRAEAAKKVVDSLGLPIGWTTPATVPACCKNESEFWKPICSRVFGGGLMGFVTLILGWIVTAFAVSLGAPFWFDTLQSVINIRNAGAKPPTGKASRATPA